jgi:hypothetical protein
MSSGHLLSKRERQLSKYLKYSLLALTLVPGANFARADVFYTDNHKPGRPEQAPEVDPSLAVAGISLLTGTLTVMRARRRK